MKKVSVILCAYNGENFLNKSLNSLCGQTLKDIEIILVNDGSIDRTQEIFEEYKRKDPRIVIIQHENMGLGLSRNAGLDAATGEYVTFLDADDWLELDAYEKAYEKTKKGNYDIIVSNHNKIFPTHTQYNVRSIKEEEIDLNQMGRDIYIMKYLLSYTHEYAVVNKLFRREFLNENNIRFPDNKTVLYEDILVNLKCACCANKIYAFNDALYNYVIRDGSLSDMKKSYSGMAAGFSNIIQLFREFIEERNMLKQMEQVLPVLYYSLVYFGLIRVKHFGKIKVADSIKQLDQYPHYFEYMSEMKKFKVRFNYIKYTLLGVNTWKNWQLNGLLCLTQLQAGVIAHFALKRDYKNVVRFM